MKKVWKALKILILASAGILFLDLCIILFFSFYRPPIHKADAIVVLGAAINTPSLYNRSLQGLKLYEAGDAGVIVLSGYMQKVIKENASATIPTILEDKSGNTYENITNTKAILGNGKSLIVVSDDFHLARSSLLAMREGFWPVYWSSPKPYYYDNDELAFYYFREVFAMLDYLPKFIFGN